VLTAEMPHFAGEKGFDFFEVDLVRGGWSRGRQVL